MLRISRVRQALVVTGITSLVLASSLVAGASTTSLKGTYNKADAAAVPSIFKGTMLQVATDASYPPDESIKGTAMVGFDIDLIKAIGVTLGLHVNENNVTFANILAGVAAGKYVVGNSSFTDKKSREKQVNFVDYFQAGEGVYALKTSHVKFTGLKSLCGLKVAVENGTTEQSDAVKTAKTCSSSKKLTILGFPAQTGANLAVSSGQANVGFVDSQVAGFIVSGNKSFKLVGNAISVAPYGMATPKTPAGRKLATAIQLALKTLIANGTYHAILAKYGVTAGGLSASQIVINGAIF